MRLARYLLRAPVSLNRMELDAENGVIRYRTDKAGTLTIDVLDFIARLTVQIPDRHQRLVSYFGVYSNASALRNGPEQTDTMRWHSGGFTVGKQEEETPALGAADRTCVVD